MASARSKISGQTAKKTAIHKRVKPMRSGQQPLTLGKSVDQQILLAVTGNFDEKVVRTKFIQMALSIPGAAGACYLTKNEQDYWLPAMASPTAGRLPDLRKFAEAFADKCDEFVNSPSINMEPLPSLDGLPGLFAPINPRKSEPEILLVVAQSQQASVQIAQVIQRIAAAFQLWLNGQNVGDTDWQIQSLASINELVAKIQTHETLTSAAEELANALANKLGCSSVAVGLVEKNKMQLKSVSGVSEIDKGSESSQNFLQTLVESTVRNQPVMFPAAEQENNFLLQAHKQLGACIHAEAVFSQPLVIEDEKIGAIVLAGPRSVLSSDKFARFSDAAAPCIATALQLVGRNKPTKITRTTSLVKRYLSIQQRYAIIGSILLFCILMFLPVTYKVRCNGVTEPVTRRFAVAPFDGHIEVGRVEPGDPVVAGQILAEMDGRALRWELSGVTAEREQSLRTREMELSSRNVPKTILAELEFDRLASEESVLKYKRDHLQIKSPTDGIVLSGSLERAEAASVETGQVLFEIGPVKPMRVEIAIPSHEIAQVQTGDSATVWIEGQEDRPIEGEIKRIHPRSETRDAKNVFIGEIEFPNDSERLRPGMKGSVRIDCNYRSLGWSLFHKPMNYVRSRLTWW